MECVKWFFVSHKKFSETMRVRPINQPIRQQWFDDNGAHRQIASWNDDNFKIKPMTVDQNNPITGAFQQQQQKTNYTQ